ncbi:GGDEF domain-containing protein [Paenibacillus sp. MMS20-IR301]|uniref:GGDEF domain-containing protein n=1 Tax=Paenibacillus sp. MMS20-IR301 TaxID=2895946 RepID=UPI0028E19C71|nr:GGDEF domain-containing protein [Paenibacillus sp. MMS20-IR301]WNS46597.1 GGDEF domain-containing protein [Paenibacillus sp. MMS20-IR301]
MLAAQILFMLSSHSSETKSILIPSKGHLFVACNLMIVAAMAIAEIWLRTALHYHKQAVVICGFIVSYLMYFVLEPFVDGAQMTLMMPIMIALIYFDKRLLHYLGLFSIVFYSVIYFGLERPLLDKPLLEFLMVECVFIVFAVMAQAVIIRARETREYLEQLTRSEQELMVERAISDKLLKMDALTGLYNHKSFHEYLDSLLEQCESNGLRLQLALFDIDNFKRVNDTYGHWVGDLVLKEVAAEVRSLIGLNDFAARYGGEEFAVIFTDKSFQEAYAAIEEIRLAIAAMQHPYAGGKPITVSIGFCDYQLGDGKETLFRKTDHALYSAKRGGKNAVVTAAVSRKDDSALSYA